MYTRFELTVERVFLSFPSWSYMTVLKPFGLMLIFEISGESSRIPFIIPKPAPAITSTRKINATRAILKIKIKIPLSSRCALALSFFCFFLTLSLLKFNLSLHLLVFRNLSIKLHTKNIAMFKSQS